jgi:NAD(P)H-dependent flavin oxidoreductase YrpB (nitropropane dioxygenase family)
LRDDRDEDGAGGEGLYGRSASVKSKNGNTYLAERANGVLSHVPSCRAYTGRAVRNRFAEAWHGREDALARDEAARTRYAEAAAQGDADIAVVFAGEGMDLIHAVEPAAAILARVIREAEAALARPLLPSA